MIPLRAALGVFRYRVPISIWSRIALASRSGKVFCDFSNESKSIPRQYCAEQNEARRIFNGAGGRRVKRAKRIRIEWNNVSLRPSAHLPQGERRPSETHLQNGRKRIVIYLENVVEANNPRMSHFPVDHVLPRHVLGIIGLFVVRPTWVELVNFHGHVSALVQVKAEPERGREGVVL